MTPIIIAVDMRDADEYAKQRRWRNYVAVTPRSRWGAHGRMGPVYATPAATKHKDYASLLDDTKPCAIGVDLDRVA